jgi:hypothetical protein
MSVVTFWRNSFSGSTFHFNLMSGFAFSKTDVKLSMVFMSELLTVAIVTVTGPWASAPVATAAIAALAAKPAPIIQIFDFI